MLDRLKALVDMGDLKGGQLRIECPLCHKRKLDLKIGDRAILASCFTIECRGRGGEILDRLSLHGYSPEELEEARALFKVNAGEVLPAAPEFILDKMYTQILNLCPMDKEGEGFLLARGFTKKAIDDFGYGVWRGRLDLDRLPPYIGVPGIHAGKVALATEAYSGILIPVRSHTKRIVSLKVRLFKPTAEGKMRTFSSALWGGPKAEVTTHFPKDLPQAADKVWVTEGELKADLAWSLGKHPVIAIPGVNCLAALDDSLKRLGATAIGLAFDQDDAGREASRRAISRYVAEYRMGLLKWKEGHKGIDDALAAGETPAMLTQDDLLNHLAIKDPPPPPPRPTQPSPAGPPPVLLRDLLFNPRPPVEYIVPNVLPLGLGLLAGKSKIGKSFLVLDLCLSVSQGTSFLREGLGLRKGKVLYFAFEDTENGLHRRLSKLVEEKRLTRESIVDDLILWHSSSGVPRMPRGLDFLKSQLEIHRPSLVVIDTLERFRPSDETGSKHSYSGDYEVLGKLKKLAEDFRCAILLVHHLKKFTSENTDDIFDAILGSSGLVGAADTILILQRRRDTQEGELMSSGREVEQIRMPLVFNNGRWTQTVTNEEERVSIIAALQGLLADGLAKDRTAVGALGQPSAIREACRSLEVEYATIQGVIYLRLPLTADQLQEMITSREATAAELITRGRFEEAQQLRRNVEGLRQRQQPSPIQWSRY